MNYHDQEWGVPVRDDRLLFEYMCLEGAQAGRKSKSKKKPSLCVSFNDKKKNT